MKPVQDLSAEKCKALMEKRKEGLNKEGDIVSTEWKTDLSKEVHSLQTDTQAQVSSYQNSSKTFYGHRQDYSKIYIER